MIHRRIFLLLAFMVSTLQMNSSFAQRTSSDSYECIIKEAKDVSEIGLLESHNFNADSVGKTFIVDRSTGLSMGEFRNFVDQDDVEIISSGSNELNFVAISFVGPFRYLNYLEIEEWRETVEKPFLAIDNIRGVLTGICTGLG
ncbi:MAG: hypothetical protein WDZ76_05800 [Pseudohongiellaceae bacterium]